MHDLGQSAQRGACRSPGAEVSEDTGLIAGNVYLYGASQGLARWFHNCDKPALTKALKLREDRRVLFGQTVGYRIDQGPRRGGRPSASSERSPSL